MNSTIIFFITFFSMLIFAIIMIGCGIYQIKTGKMVAKRKKQTIDEPRQVGFIFLALGIICLLIMIGIIGNPSNPFTSQSILQSLALWAGWAVAVFAFIAAAIYGLRTKRIYGFKNTKNFQVPVKKYYLPVNLVLLALPLEGMALAISPFFIVYKDWNWNIQSIIIVCMLVTSLLLAVLMLTVSLKAKRK